MGKLKRQLRSREKQLKHRKKQTRYQRAPSYEKKVVEIRQGDSKKTLEIPTFDINGKPIQPEKRRKRKRLLIGFSVTAGILSFVYLPQFFMTDGTEISSGEFTIETNQEAIRNSNVVLRDNPQEDFDDDGILNADETTKGTDPWNIDTDGDGVTDYAELHITQTSPTEYTQVLMDTQIKLDESEDKTLANPYSIGDVILWPDTYESKAYGSVIRTDSGGYRFCGFTGSVQFPDIDDKEAYTFAEGIHTYLEKDPSDSTWMVKDGDYVELYDQKLDEMVKVGVFGLSVSLKADWYALVLDAVFPEHGFLTARKITSMDLSEAEEEVTVNDIIKPIFKESDYVRLQGNMTSSDNLSTVREAVRRGKCAAVSLFSSEAGEYLGIIYGITDTGDLLVADMETLEAAGEIQITEKARKILNDQGEIVSLLYYDWSMDGFSSLNNDRISFFAYSTTMYKE